MPLKKKNGKLKVKKVIVVTIATLKQHIQTTI